ncbi:MAG: nickel pincer cofactor biosynthesis protein LarC [Phycisphaerae bacterium]|nr:nickel pincer cofactor biosynthesis protein LarC [Phycisphaerae bacterium]
MLLHVDCFSGAAGDMIVGALLDAGCDFDALRSDLAKLPLTDYALRAEKVTRQGLAGTKFHVDLAESPTTASGAPQRHLTDILAMIASAGLAPRAADRAKRIFTRLADAEARAHDIARDEVHFHEIGAADSILDIVGACVALELLEVDRLVCGPIPIGHGTIHCAHGTMPAPAPATALLLSGARTVSADVPREVTTPTAAAVLTTLAETFGPLCELDVRAVGYGAGSRDDGPMPNLLRVYLGEPGDAGTADTVVELTANLDDCTGEWIGATIDALLSVGCLDAWVLPITMKRSRPGWMLCALAAPSDVTRAEQIIFRQTTTFGIRRRAASRTKLARSFQTVETRYGPVRVKLGRLGNEVVTVAPEFADCLAAAETHHVAPREVLAAAQAALREGAR